MKKIVTSAFILAALALSSCGTTDNASKTAVESKKEVKSEMKKIEGEWKLAKLVMNGMERDIYPASLLVKAEGNGYMFSGNSGVNQFTGSVKIDADNNFIVTAPFGSTRMAGPTEVMEFEDDFLKVLSFAGKIKTGETLELLDIQSESKLVFKR